MVDVQVETVALAPDLLLVIDRSSTMGETLQGDIFTQKWDVMREAVGTLVTDRQDAAEFGLMLFPAVGETCAPGTLEVVPSLSGAGEIESKLSTIPPGGGTPMSTSLENVLEYFDGADVNPYGRNVVLVTDGLPSCEIGAVEKTLDAVSALEASGIATFVLGFALQGDPQTLDDMAELGGTGAHYPVESPGELAATLDSITTEVSEVSCDYALTSVPADSGILSVTIDGEEVPEGAENGWGYDLASETLTFHGDACDKLRGAGDADILLSYCHQVD